MRDTAAEGGAIAWPLDGDVLVVRIPPGGSRGRVAREALAGI
jgi:hypothetical protein